MSDLREAIRAAIEGVFPVDGAGRPSYCLEGDTSQYHIELMVDRVLDVVSPPPAPDPDRYRRIEAYIDERIEQVLTAKLTPPPVAKSIGLDCRTRYDEFRTDGSQDVLRLTCIDHGLVANVDPTKIPPFATRQAAVYAELTRLHRERGLL